MTATDPASDPVLEEPEPSAAADSHDNHNHEIIDSPPPQPSPSPDGAACDTDTVERTPSSFNSPSSTAALLLLPTPTSAPQFHHPLVPLPYPNYQSFSSNKPKKFSNETVAAFPEPSSLVSSNEAHPFSQTIGVSDNANGNEFSQSYSHSSKIDPSEADESGAIVAEVNVDDKDQMDGEDAEFPPGYQGNYPFRWRKFLRFVGPGWLMSIAYLDPGNLEADLQTGAYAGFQLLWVLLLATLLGFFMQTLALRLGVVTGRHLAQHCRAHFSKPRRYMTWLAMECAVIASDIQEVLGSALAFKVLFGLPLWSGVLITAADTFTFLFLHYAGIRKLEAFFAALVSTMFVCFFINFGLVKPSAAEMFEGFVPTMQSYAVLQAVGLLGSIIMPHNMYLHSALVQSRQINRRRLNRVTEANMYFTVEAFCAIAISFLINFAVVVIFAQGFFDSKCAADGLARVNGECSSDVGFTNAADALKALLGPAARIVWGIGLLASGQSSTMTGVQTGQFIMSGFLDLKMTPWKRILLTRSIALVPSVSVALSSLGETNALDVTTGYINVIMSILLPFSVLPLLHFTSDITIMGTFVNTAWKMVLGWTFSALAIGINIYLLVQLIIEANVSRGYWALFVVLAVAYFACIVVLLKDELVVIRRVVVKLWKRRHGRTVKSNGNDRDGAPAGAPICAGDAKGITSSMSDLHAPATVEVP